MAHAIGTSRIEQATGRDGKTDLEEDDGGQQVGR